MRITIYDLDFYSKHSFLPNPKAMKVSSYYKQKEDLVNFVTEEDHILMDFDIMYIFKEKERSPFPPSLLIDDPRVRLIGRYFKIYEGYSELEIVMEMCRPDYQLYPLKKNNAYANAHVVQLLHKTTLLPMKQDFTNRAAKGHKKHLIVDEFLWKSEKEIILKCLEELKGLKNIVFLKPISLKVIILNKNVQELFLELHFSRGTIFRFKNDYGSEFKEAKEIIDFMYELKQKNDTIAITGFPIKTVLYDHWKDLSLGIKDLERCLKIVDYAKERKIKVLLKLSNRRLITPHWAYFDILQVWTEYRHRRSFIHMMLASTMERNNVTMEEILNDPLKWSAPRVHFLLHLLLKYPAVINKYGRRQWGNSMTSLDKVDLTSVIQREFYFNQEKTLKRLEEELQR